MRCVREELVCGELEPGRVYAADGAREEQCGKRRSCSSAVHRLHGHGAPGPSSPDAVRAGGAAIILSPCSQLAVNLDGRRGGRGEHAALPHRGHGPTADAVAVALLRLQQHQH